MLKYEAWKVKSSFNPHIVFFAVTDMLAILKAWPGGGGFCACSETR